MINHIQNKSLCMCVYAVDVLCIYKYTHVYI